jgi:drug/metabolite transporter (DMT)-like permease
VDAPGLDAHQRPLLQLMRSVLLLASTLCNFAALRYLQLDEAIALIFSTPFFVAALSGPILGEWVHWRRWTAIAIGFLGVLVVTRPGAGSFHPAALLSLYAALCYALYSISTRILARTDSNETTLFYSNLVGFLALMPVVPFGSRAPPSWSPPASTSSTASGRRGRSGDWPHHMRSSPRGHRATAKARLRASVTRYASRGPSLAGDPVFLLDCR